MSDTANRLSKGTLVLHWIIAPAMIGMLGFGLYIASLPKGSGKGDLIQIHKMVGVAVLIFAAYRFIRRMLVGFPPDVVNANYQAYEMMAAKATHWLLLLGTLIMPISGMVMSLAGGHDVNLFGLATIPGFEEKDKALSGLARSVHEYAGYILIAGIGFHVVGAVKHHVIDKDGTLSRMLGKTIA